MYCYVLSGKSFLLQLQPASLTKRTRIREIKILRFGSYNKTFSMRPRTTYSHPMRGSKVGHEKQSYKHRVLVRKYYIRVEVTDSDKHSSLFNYNCKKFYCLYPF
jgi:hypothetical protein